MTLFHFGNCLALGYVPYLIVYRCTGLAEYSAFWKCVQAGAIYLFTQLCKMLLLATFFPTSDFSSGNVDFVAEFMKTTVDVGDLIGFYFILNNTSAKGELRFLIAGMGWASAEFVMTRFVPFWIGARGTEFDWKYIQMSLESNLNLMQHLATATLVWLWTRRDLYQSIQPIVVAVLALSCYKPLIMELLIFAIGLQSWPLLLVKAIFTSLISLVALQMFTSLQATTNHYSSR